MILGNSSTRFAAATGRRRPRQIRLGSVGGGALAGVKAAGRLTQLIALGRPEAALTSGGSDQPSLEGACARQQLIAPSQTAAPAAAAGDSLHASLGQANVAVPCFTVVVGRR